MSKSSDLTDVFSLDQPDIAVNLRATSGIDTESEVAAFSSSNEYVPDMDNTYRFDTETTLAIWAGFTHNRCVMIQGYHGTGVITYRASRCTPQLALYPH